MRLTDADKQLEWVDCMTPIYGIGLEPVVAVETVRDLIKGAPTIDAIPMEWMRDKMRGYASSLKSTETAALVMVMQMWQKEQEGEIVADFVQTMKDWQRMCDTIKSCKDCPMYEDGWTYILCSEGGISSARPEVAEGIVTKWAAEHPEPVYPTWGTWLAEVTGQMVDGDLLYSPIPADIAQKLGIEPKEDIC